MGKEFIDIWTLGHFTCGFLSSYTLIPIITPSLDVTPIVIIVIVTNIIHFILESLENSKNEHTGEILETPINHLGDIIAFVLGSVLAAGLLNYKVILKPNILFSIFILAILTIIIIQEACRELWPSTWVFDSSYKPVAW